VNEQRKLNLARRSISADLPVIGISKSLTQSESKRLPQLLPVLDYILQNSIFSANQIEKSVKKVSRDSIDRTLKMLKEKNLIEFKETKAKGEKFYKIKSKPKLRSYQKTLFKWHLSKILFKNKVQKQVTKFTKTLRRNEKLAMHSSRLITETQTKKQLRFVSESKQKQFTTIPYPESIKIYDLPFTEGNKIVKNYQKGLLCDICFKENFISFLTEADFEQVCELGHTTFLQNTNEFLVHSAPITRKKSKSISNYELEKQTKDYLKIKRSKR
jgi:DNA-binding HxlR family transcriptional regulator